MSDIDPILFAIRAAKAANLAAIEALTAVERMLGEGMPATEPESEHEGCQHDDAVEVSTGAGTFLVCSCGHQEQL